MTLDAASPGRIHIGISGWRYKGWRGVFYPEKLPQRRELEFASRKFDTIELNGSFYSLQKPQSFLRWHDETPPGFTFAIKGSRYITHMLRLRNVEGALANFFAQGLLHFGAKLGPILWQLPPNFPFESERIEQFLALLPRTVKQAAELARNHDDRLNDRSWFQVRKDAPLRHALEIRHESFATEKFVSLLVYCRLHGSEQLYASGYEADALDVWARRVVAWARGAEVTDGRRASARDAPKRKRREVFVYFDNDIKVRAPFDAEQLRMRVNELLTGAAPERRVEKSPEN
jgi:uncharacterized protein YecE (DUF72 family)